MAALQNLPHSRLCQNLFKKMSKTEKIGFENGKEDTTEGINVPISSVVEDHDDPLLPCDQNDENLV